MPVCAAARSDGRACYRPLLNGLCWCQEVLFPESRARGLFDQCTHSTNTPGEASRMALKYNWGNLPRFLLLLLGATLPRPLGARIACGCCRLTCAWDLQAPYSWPLSSWRSLESRASWRSPAVIPCCPGLQPPPPRQALVFGAHRFLRAKLLRNIQYVHQRLHIQSY